MKPFKKYLEERYVNVLPHTSDEEKHKYKHEVFNMVKKAYEPIGGIHGSGFKDADDMVKNIHMWKLHKQDGKVKGVVLYKNSAQGRKRVAVASDGSHEGKSALGKMMTSDYSHERAHGEVSGPSLSFLKKHIHIADHALSFEKAKEYHEKNGDNIEKPKEDDPEVLKHPELKDHFYVRDIGGEKHTKLLVGSVGKHIK